MSQVAGMFNLVDEPEWDEIYENLPPLVGDKYADIIKEFYYYVVCHHIISSNPETESPSQSPNPDLTSQTNF